MPRGIPNNRETRPEETVRVRKERVAFGAARSKLATPEIEGYFSCWINDVGTRLFDAQEGGYEFATPEMIGKVGQGLSQAGWVEGQSSTDSRISRVVGKQEDGSPMRAFLMIIKQAWRDEDMAARQKVNDEIDASLRGGNVSGTEGQDGRYIPSQGIKIT